MIFSGTILLSILALSQAGCDNSCSGHGVCECGFCQCYDNWGMGIAHDNGDCSDRICPFEIAWVDTPDADGLHHRYAECAGKGICNTESGECECFEGYEGKGCQRTTCPNDCSGHGVCNYINDLTFGTTSFDIPHTEYSVDGKTFDYFNWDAGKTRGCVCDPEWGDVDCSKHLCMYATDTQDHRDNMAAAQKYQIQQFTFDYTAAVSGAETFAVTFKAKINESFTTIPIVIQASDFDLMAEDIESALERLPNNVIDQVQVMCGNSPSVTVGNSDVTCNVTFTGANTQGDQNLLIISADACADGCTPRITGLDLKELTGAVTVLQSADFNSYECGRRGKCDYGTGICQCFEGFTGAACNQCTSLI